MLEGVRGPDIVRHAQGERSAAAQQRVLAVPSNDPQRTVQQSGPRATRERRLDHDAGGGAAQREEQHLELEYCRVPDFDEPSVGRRQGVDVDTRPSELSAELGDVGRGRK